MSFTNAEFCDTNVLGYAVTAVDDPRRTIAVPLVERLASSGGAVSIQVLQELFVVMTRKARPPVPLDEARAVIRGLARWTVFAPGTGDVIEAIDNSQRWQVSFWDSLILTAANKLGARVLWSEDLNHGQAYGQTTVRNPFV
jgi:predicted nucleic acid-binding protein